jgi:methionyl-tRNA formyltransferase
MSLRIVFMGTAEFAVPTFVEIVSCGHEVVAVYTRAPKPGGRRGLTVVPGAVEREARRFDLPVVTPATLRSDDAQNTIRSFSAQVAVIVAYGLILPKPVLEAFPLGCFNLHASLLPRWRGAAPITRAIMAGDPQTGVMVMKMEEGLDTGPIAMAEHLAIQSDMTAGDLSARLAHLGADLMLRALAALERSSLTLTPQPQKGVTYAAKIDKDETRIAWKRPWQEVHNRIRGLSPSPGAWFELTAERSAAERVKVLRSTKGEGAGVPGTIIDDKLTVACAEGAVRIVELQRAGRQAMKALDFLRGTPVVAGTVLS